MAKYGLFKIVNLSIFVTRTLAHTDYTDFPIKYCSCRCDEHAWREMLILEKPLRFFPLSSCIVKADSFLFKIELNSIHRLKSKRIDSPLTC